MSDKCIKEIDESFQLVQTIDAKDKKIGLILNLGAIIVAAIVYIVIRLIVFPSGVSIELNLTDSIAILVTAVAYFAYIIVHELTHGIFYKAFTKEKLTFGISWSCAFCGVPSVYVKKKYALIASLAPLVLLSIPMIVGIVLLALLGNNDLYIILLSIFFAIHVGGCVGDMYVAYLMLFKLKGEIYIRDDGAKQEFYQKITID